MEFPRSNVRGKARTIVLIPLIDILFLLMTYFVLVGHIEKFEVVAVEPPKADSGQLLEEGHIVVVLGKRDEILINDELVDPSQISTVIRQQLKNNPNRIISLKADAALAANKLIEMMDVIKSAGGQNLSLVTQSQPGAK